ncbi:HlyD family efflux transporter periplasmic adaptor subunit [Stenotrophomonas sp. TWI1149]|uniref:HlyD family secretion protein n=1 Tax=unclassified Stenotrophomonas TaxID=196198 RepID=UPI00320B8718
MPIISMTNDKERAVGKVALFRREALEASRQRYGAPIRVPGVGLWTTTAFVVLLVTAVLIFLNSASYPQTQAVNGNLVPSSGLLTLSAPAAGVFTAVSVEEGSYIMAGDLIATLSIDRVTSDGLSVGAVRAKMGEQLTISSIEKGQASDASLDSQEASARERSRGIGEQLSTLDGSAANLESMIVLAEKTVQDYDGLRQERIVTELQYRDALTRVLTTKQGLADTQIRISELKQERAQLSHELRRLEAERKLNRAVNSADMINSKDKELAYKAESAVALTAPSTGRLTSLRIQPGAWVEGGKAVGAVMPSGSKFLAELWVPSTVIAAVGSGTKVRIKYDAFPYQKFGVASARIIKVAQSPTAISDLPPDIQAQESHFRVIAELNNQKMSVGQAEFMLVPGMRFKADVILEERSMMDWILRPLSSQFDAK